MNKVISREYVEKNYIHKDIIRRLIKNLDKEEENLQKNISDEEREEYSDCSISYELCDIYTRREVLNKLLEKE